MADFYITTAIDYVNGSPHIGHAYEKVLTDVIARYRRLMGDRVYFLTGTDEHGQKVQQTARKKGIDPLKFADEMSAEFKAMLPRLEISNDDFIRTTEERHKRVVRELLQRLFDKGDIYKGEYRGFYSTRQEQFLQEKDRNPDGSWPEIYGEVAEIVEPNYFFKLRSYQGWLVGVPRGQPGLYISALPTEAGRRVPQGAAERPVHFPAKGAARVGNPPPVRPGVRDLCLVRRPGELLLGRRGQAWSLARHLARDR